MGPRDSSSPPGHGVSGDQRELDHITLLVGGGGRMSPSLSPKGGVMCPRGIDMAVVELVIVHSGYQHGSVLIDQAGGDLQRHVLESACAAACAYERGYRSRQARKTAAPPNRVLETAQAA